MTITSVAKGIWNRIRPTHVGGNVFGILGGLATLALVAFAATLAVFSYGLVNHAITGGHSTVTPPANVMLTTGSRIHEIQFTDDGGIQYIVARGISNPSNNCATEDTSTEVTDAQRAGDCSEANPSITKPKFIDYLALIGPTYVAGVIIFVCWFLFRRIMQAALNAKPFAPSVPKYLKVIALLLAISRVLGFVMMSNAFKHLHVSDYSVTNAGTFSFTTALLVYAVAKIIEYGVSLQEEVEATV